MIEDMWGNMGKQLNYWMDYSSFVLLAKKALELGFIIYREKPDANGKVICGTNIEVITEGEKNYYFYLPMAGKIEIINRNGIKHVRNNPSNGNVVVEAGYSHVNEKSNPKKITRSRIYCSSGYYDNNRNYIERPESLTQAYNSLAKYVKKIAPYTELHDSRISLKNENYGQTVEYNHEEYVTDWCLQKREDGYILM